MQLAGLRPALACQPDYSIAVGAPARVVRNRMVDYQARAADRAAQAAALTDIERKAADAIQGSLAGGDPV